MAIRDRVVARFIERFGSLPDFIIRSPGRVNLLGEHVDYNDGFVLPISIDRATWMAFSGSGNGLTTLDCIDFFDEVTLSPDGLRGKADVHGKPLSKWALYPAGINSVLNEENLSCQPMNACYSSTVPVGSGLSSSASVEMAFVLAWQSLGGWKLGPLERALLGQKAENEYVGVKCGIMDQFACACGDDDHIMALDCRSLEWQTLPLPQDTAIIIADTTIRRTLTSGDYNDRRLDCEEAVRRLQEFIPEMKALRDIDLNTFNRLATHLPDRIRKRARHVVEEIERTQKAIGYLQQGKIDQFGRLVNECHTSLRDLYEVSIHELDVMVGIAQSLPGCHGARLTGAGFGGCTVNLVQANQAEEFTQRLMDGYKTRTGLNPDIFITKASHGTEVI